MEQRIKGNLSQQYRAVHHAYSIVYEDQRVIIDLNTGLFFGLNEVSAVMWELLVECGMTPQEVVNEIIQQYEVDPVYALRDIEMFIEEMQCKYLLLLVNDEHNSRASSQKRCYARYPLTDLLLPLLFVLRNMGLKRWRILEWLESWITLRSVAWWLKNRGLHAFATQLGMIPAHRYVGPNDADVQRIVIHMVSAARWQHFHTACLHQYLALCWMLRRRGVLANLVIGVELFPFFAHAWLKSGPDPFQHAIHWQIGIGQRQSLQRLRSLSILFSTEMVTSEALLREERV